MRRDIIRQGHIFSQFFYSKAMNKGLLRVVWSKPLNGLSDCTEEHPRVSTVIRRRQDERIDRGNDLDSSRSRHHILFPNSVQSAGQQW